MASRTSRREWCVVFPRLSGWAGTVVNSSTQHWRGRSDTSFSCEKVYKAILTLTLTKQALRERARSREVNIERCVVQADEHRTSRRVHSGEVRVAGIPSRGSGFCCGVRMCVPTRILNDLLGY